MILDIHAAAKEIAEVNEINLEKIWDMLLEKWLCPSTVPGEVSAYSQPKDAVLQAAPQLASLCCSNTSAPQGQRL